MGLEGAKAQAGCVMIMYNFFFLGVISYPNDQARNGTITRGLSLSKNGFITFLYFPRILSFVSEGIIGGLFFSRIF